MIMDENNRFDSCIPLRNIDGSTKLGNTVSIGLSEYELNFLRCPGISEVQRFTVPMNQFRGGELYFQLGKSHICMTESDVELSLDITHLVAESGSDITWAVPVSHIDPYR